mmetsp:Transcript_39389/g.72677  ORF Transcript_39389/g.72677 Transcript_39389/m.72677 type:complete len:245 (-) Transcript_39389:100-834(-)
MTSFALSIATSQHSLYERPSDRSLSAATLQQQRISLTAAKIRNGASLPWHFDPLSRDILLKSSRRLWCMEERPQVLQQAPIRSPALLILELLSTPPHPLHAIFLFPAESLDLLMNNDGPRRSQEDIPALPKGSSNLVESIREEASRPLDRGGTSQTSALDFRCFFPFFLGISFEKSEEWTFSLVDSSWSVEEPAAAANSSSHPPPDDIVPSVLQLRQTKLTVSPIQDVGPSLSLVKRVKNAHRR